MLIKGFSKVNEMVSPENLRPDELVIFKNMVLEQTEAGGNPTKRKGYEDFLSAGSSEVYSLHKAVNKYWGVQGTKFRNYSGGVWADVKDITNSKTRLVPFNDKVIVTNGIEVPFIANGGNWNLEIERPNIQETYIERATGGGTKLGTGLYRWIFVFITDTGEIGNISMPISYFNGEQDLNTFISGTSNIARFFNTPNPTDTRVTAIKLFRTKANGLVYYFSKSLGTGTSTFEDSMADTDLDESQSIEFINVPKAKYSALNNERLFLGNIEKTIKNAVMPPSSSQFIDPDASTLLVDNGSPAIEDGNYRWAFSFLDDEGNESELSTYVEREIDQATDGYAWTSGNTRVNFTSIPRPRIGAGRYDPKIVSTRLYRTKAPSLSTFYWVEDFDTNSEFIFDNKRNINLTEPYPKSGKGFNTVENFNSAIVYSEIGKPSEINELNIIQVFPDDGEVITGIFDDRDGILIFKENSICKLYTSGSPVNWRLYKIHKNIGSDEPESIYQQNNEFYFVHNKRPYVFRGGEPTPIGELYQKSFDLVTEFKASTYFTKKNWYVLSVATTEDLLYIYDVKIDTWYKFTVNGGEVLLDDDNLLIGSNTYVLRYGDASQDVIGGIAYDINATMRTKTFGFPDGIAYGRLRFLYCNFVTAPSNIVFTIQDPDLDKNRTLTLNNIITKSFTFKRITDALSGTLTKFKKIYINIEGIGITQFLGLKLEYRSVRLEDYATQQNILVDEDEEEVLAENEQEIEL
jgi:hypothetical protein